ncbi:hypothetical protein D9M71_190060 [compost metagenome]
MLLLLLDELDEKPPKAFLMARIDGYSYAEIARTAPTSSCSSRPTPPRRSRMRKDAAWR